MTIMEAEAYLIRDALFAFVLPEANPRGIRNLEFLNLQKYYNLLPMDKNKGSDLNLALQLQKIFSNENCEEKKKLKLKISNTSSYNEQARKFVTYPTYLQTDIRCGMFRSLLTCFGDEMQLRLELREAEAEWPSPNFPNDITTSILKWKEECGQPVYSGNTNKFPPQWLNYWDSPLKLKFSVRISIIICGDLVFKDSPSIASNIDSVCTEDKTEILTKKLLEEKIATDIAIVTPEGIKFECHKSFLIAQSGVFQTMLETGRYREGESGQIEIEDMTEKGVLSLLAFLYYRGLDEPLKNPQISLELLRASQKYDISSLEKAMQSIIVQKPVDWFDISTIIQLFFFSKKVEGIPDVKLRLIEILKLRRAEIGASDEFMQLFEDVDDQKRVAARELSVALTTL